jgi:trk/ktr system potassium uptake protein
MEIAIIGAGQVGYHLADILSREDHRVSVIDADPAMARRLMESLDVQVVVGDATRADVLNSGGVSTADLVVVVTDNDQVNMLACSMCRQMGAGRVILRLRDTTVLEGYRYFYKQALGFDVVLSTEELASEEIVNMVRQQHALEVESFSGGRVQLRRFRLAADSVLLGGPLAELDLPAGVLVGAVARGEKYFIPTGMNELQAGDNIYVIGKRGDLDAFERTSGAPSLGRRSVVILGAGRLGREITRRLADVPGISTRVIEKDPKRAKSLAAEHSGRVMVLDGDATDLDLLHEERIDKADVFIATTNDDESNMVACQLVKNLGVKRTVAMVNNGSYRQIYDLLGIDQAISPRILCANRILRFVRSSSVSAIAVLGEGRAEVIEVRIGHDSKRDARKIKSLGLPKGTVVGTVIRGEEVIVPSGDTVVHGDDQVIVFTLPESVEGVLNILHAEEA